MRWLALVIAVGGCAVEPHWEEGEIGVLSPGLTVGGAGGCSTFIVDGLSQQLIAEQNCIRAGALVSFAGKPGLSVGSNVYAFAEAPAAAALEKAGQAMQLDITSAFRTVAQQYLLYHWYQTGQCGISLAAVPGNSNHETGTAVDLSNYAAAVNTMAAENWQHSYPSSDPVHFDFIGAGTIDLRSESVLAFQKLWNENNTTDTIAEDGAYGPTTEAKLVASPATGFPKGATCTKPPPPPNADGGTAHDGGATDGGATPDGGAGHDGGGTPGEDGGSGGVGGNVPADSPPKAKSHSGCSIGGTPDGAATAWLLALVLVTLAGRRRASYSSGRCRALPGSSSSSPSPSR